MVAHKSGQLSRFHIHPPLIHSHSLQEAISTRPVPRLVYSSALISIMCKQYALLITITMHLGKGNSKKLISRINAFTSICVRHNWCVAFCLTVKSFIVKQLDGYCIYVRFVLWLLYPESLMRLVIQELYSLSGGFSDDRGACVWCTIVIQYHAHCCISIHSLICLVFSALVMIG